MEKAIDLLDEIKEGIINAYEEKSHLSRAKIAHMMDEETWLNAKKALNLGFVDGILFAKNEPQKKPESEPEEEPEQDTPEEDTSNEEEDEPDFLLPDSASRYLTEADLEDLTWRELCLARNEIFARHGRLFVTPEIAEYFNSKPWYEGQYDEVTLNSIETANVNFILSYENRHFGGSYY